MSKILDKELVRKLSHIGLTEKEAKVYISLLSMSIPVGSSKIVRATGLHGQNVYDALGTLEEKSLVKHVLIKGRKRFSANHPSRLEVVVEDKKRLVREVASDLASLSGKPREQEFEIYQGESSFVVREIEELENSEGETEWLIIGGSGDTFEKVMGKSFEIYEDLRNQKSISVRYVGSEEQREDLADIQKERTLFNYRILPTFRESMVNTLIRPDSVSFTSYGDPLLTYKVINKGVAQSYRNFFEALWAQCQEENT